MPRRSDITWIVHPDPEARLLLRRLAGDPEGPDGGPDDFPVDDAPAPRAIVLHVDADPALALDFAHRASRLHPRAAWVLLRDDRAPADEAFAGLGAELLAWPAEADRLAAALARARSDGPTGIRARRQRDALARRFARTLGELGLPDLGGIVGGRVVVRGEPGTGRMLVARVVHALADPPGALVQVDCAAERALAELAAKLEAASGAERLVICLERPERLAPERQRELASWIELGPPGVALDLDRSVWIALIGELAGATPTLEPTLALALAGHELRLPPLRRRAGAAEKFAAATLRSLAAATGTAPRELTREAAELIARSAWPGNFRELEAVLRRAAARGGEGPIDAPELAAEGAAGPPAALEPPLTRPAPARPAPVRPLRPAQAPPAAAAARAAAPSPAPAPAPPERERAPAALLQSLAHSLRNPLVSLKTFASLLPEHYDEEDFRVRFRRQTERDLASLEKHLDRLGRFGELDLAERKAVNVAALLEGLLRDHQAEIKSRRLLVMSELGTDAPWALAPEAGLRFALEALLDATFARIGDRQDLYIACRRPSAPPGAAPKLRILLRFHGAALTTLPGGEPAALELVLAEAVFEALGGRLVHESLESGEQVARVDLPATSGEV
jgi:DNA-binding NtrC family response regulator